MKRIWWFTLGVLVAIAATAYGLTVNGELKGALLELSTSDPTCHEGRVFYDTDDNLARVCNGSTWETFSPALTDPMTTRGDILHRDSGNATARLAIGADNRLLRSDGTDPAWGQIDHTDFFTSGAVATRSAEGLLENFDEDDFTVVFDGTSGSGNGVTSTSVDCDFKARRFVDMIIVEWANCSLTSGTTSAAFFESTSGDVAADFRPAQDTYVPISARKSSGTQKTGMMLIRASGNIRCYNDFDLSTVWDTSDANHICRAGSVTYYRAN